MCSSQVLGFMFVLLLGFTNGIGIDRVHGPSDLDIVNAEFSMNLLRETYGDINSSKSSILSPLSVAIALAMTYAGAQGTTYDQMNEVLAGGVSNTDYNQFMKQLLNDISETDALNAANKVFIKEGFELKQEYLDTIKSVYQGQLAQVDFTQALTVAEEINDWVSNQTNAKITDLVEPGMFSARTRMVLVNAIYFNGIWKYAFDEKKTQKRTFHVTKGVTKQVDMMSTKGNFLYYSNDQIQFLGLPYKTEDMFMYVVLPREKYGLSSIIEQLNGQTGLEWIQKVTEQNVLVEMPRFKLEEKLNLNRALSKMGIVDAFTGAANFGGISEEHLEISDVVHKAFIEVNEKGTEAAAATSVVVRHIMAIIEPIKFTMDHPFIFSINKGNTTIFIGQFQ